MSFDAFMSYLGIFFLVVELWVIGWAITSGVMPRRGVR